MASFFLSSYLGICGISMNQIAETMYIRTVLGKKANPHHKTLFCYLVSGEKVTNEVTKEITKAMREPFFLLL